MTPDEPTPSPASEPLTLRAQGPEDLLAAVPVVLGFEPEDSLVMLTFSGRHRFHARLDLPTAPAAIPDAVHALLAPAVRHDVDRVAFVLYTGDAGLAARLAERLLATFLDAGIEVVDCMRAHGGRWWAALGTRGHEREVGGQYDAASHRFRVQAVVDGLVTLRSRAEVEASVAPLVDATLEVEAELGGAPPLGQAGLAALVAAGLVEGRLDSASETAGLLRALRTPRLRDQTWSRMSRERADEHVRLWTWVLRRAPGGHAADPAALLAFSAWLAGNGALAWCALDRCFAADPAHPLGRLVATALEAATPPSTWKRSA